MPAKERPLSKRDKALIERFFKLLAKKPSLVGKAKFIAVENDGLCEKCGRIACADDGDFADHSLWKHEGKWCCRECQTAEDD